MLYAVTKLLYISLCCITSKYSNLFIEGLSGFSHRLTNQISFHMDILHHIMLIAERKYLKSSPPKDIGILKVLNILVDCKFKINQSLPHIHHIIMLLLSFSPSWSIIEHPLSRGFIIVSWQGYCFISHSFSCIICNPTRKESITILD